MPAEPVGVSSDTPAVRSETSASKSEDGDRSAYTIRAVERVCAILDLIQRHPQGFTLTQVVDATGLPKSSAFRYLATLEAQRYVEREAVSGNFRIGPAFIPLQMRQLDVLVERARPLLEDLRNRFEETINLVMLDGNRVSYLEIVESPRSMRLAARKGDRDPLHSTAVGKAIATLISEARLIAILGAEGMPARTHRTIIDPTVYLGEVAVTRKRGFALDDGENEDDGRCVAVPIVGAGIPAAVSLSAPAARFPLAEVETVAAALAEVAGQLVTDLDD